MARQGKAGSREDRSKEKVKGGRALNTDLEAYGSSSWS